MADYRPLIQLATLALGLFVLGVMLAVKIKTGTLPRSMYGVTALSAHFVVYYTFVLLWAFDIFSITAFLNELFGIDWLSYGLWSAAIRLQTVIELALMSIIVYRRYVWTQEAS